MPFSATRENPEKIGPLFPSSQKSLALPAKIFSATRESRFSGFISLALPAKKGLRGANLFSATRENPHFQAGVNAINSDRWRVKRCYYTLAPRPAVAPDDQYGDRQPVVQ